jgi:predicted  nucleic acid-binding Zn-ribbon protein
MPHQCTNCGKMFADGSKEMLSGCPDCGGNKFQFRPQRATDTGRDDGSSEPTPSGAAPNTPPDGDQRSSSDETDRSGVTGTAARAGASVREWVGNRTTTDSADTDAPDTPASADVTIEPNEEQGDDADASADDLGSESPPTPTEGSGSHQIDDTEDRAQASARSDVVTPEELSAAENRPVEEQPADADGTVIEPESDDRPDLSDLRAELNDQFESIKILQPGQYELNLMELYDRDEYIISLREDGRYVIEVPDTWRGSADED